MVFIVSWIMIIIVVVVVVIVVVIVVLSPRVLQTTIPLDMARFAATVTNGLAIRHPFAFFPVLAPSLRRRFLPWSWCSSLSFILPVAGFWFPKIQTKIYVYTETTRALFPSIPLLKTLTSGNTRYLLQLSRKNLHSQLVVDHRRQFLLLSTENEHPHAR